MGKSGGKPAVPGSGLRFGSTSEVNSSMEEIAMGAAGVPRKSVRFESVAEGEVVVVRA